MIPTPIMTVLGTLRDHGVRCLLTGGQACVLYGGAEFSRDIDVAVLASDDNLDRLGKAVAALQATVEYVPPFEARYLRRGHTVHFRCGRPDTGPLRLDVMTVMRGVAPFPELWERRTTLHVDGAGSLDLLALPDLVASKKTRRPKDWPMVQRLVEANYEQFGGEPTPPRVSFWLAEGRTPELLVECAERFPEETHVRSRSRELLALATSRDTAALTSALDAEQRAIMAEDQAFWTPLLRELETLRHEEARRRRGP